MDTMRYTVDGDRSMVAVKADDLLNWATSENYVKSDAADALEEMYDFGLKLIDARMAAAMQEAGVKLQHCHAGPGTCVHVPFDFYIWEVAHSDTTGLRLTHEPVDIGGLATCAKLPLSVAANQHAAALREVSAFLA